MMSQRPTGSYTHANGFPDFWEEFWTKLKMLTCFDKMGHVLCRSEFLEKSSKSEYIGSILGFHIFEPTLWYYILFAIVYFTFQLKNKKNMIYTGSLCNTTFGYIEGVERKKRDLFF